MLNAKKMGHSVYSFQRKKDYFMKLNNIINHDIAIDYKNNNLLINLRNKIVHKNMESFSLFFETLTLKEKYLILKNENLIKNFLNSSKWIKGNKYFDLIFKHIRESLK